MGQTNIFAMAMIIQYFTKTFLTVSFQCPAPNVSVSYAPEDDFSEFTPLLACPLIANFVQMTRLLSFITSLATWPLPGPRPPPPDT